MQIQAYKNYTYLYEKATDIERKQVLRNVVDKIIIE